MRNDIEEVLIGSEEIKKKVRELGARISKDYEGKDLLLVGVLTGGFVFMADLMREITIPVDTDFISVSSYGNSTRTSGVVRIIKDINTNITDKHILIVEDIVDTGLTLKHLTKLLKTRNPLSVRICTILDKPSRRKANIKIDYEGIVIPDKFVVGYGLDYGGKYRNLPDICTLSPKVYANSSEKVPASGA